MKTYQGSEIRNVAVMGHAHSGKTTFIAALLHAAKMTPAQGRVADGTAVTAYDEEEIARGATMQNAVAFAEWQGVKINLVDTPGFHMFSHEARAALLPVEAAVVIVNAQNGVEAVTERVWRYAEEANVPRVVVVNQMDHPKAGGGGGLSALMEDLVDRWGRNCVPVQLPISDSQGFHGVVDLVTMEAFYYTPGGDGRGKVTGEIPANLAADAKARHEALVELVAEGKDELMEEFFEKGTFPDVHLIAALLEAIHKYLGNRVQMTGDGAGVHVVLWLDRRASEKAIIEKAAARGVGVYGVSRYFLRHPRQGLMLRSEERRVGKECLE